MLLLLDDLLASLLSLNLLKVMFAIYLAADCRLQWTVTNFSEIIGAAQSFNRERANSISSSIGIDNQIYADSDGDDDDDDEVVIGDFSSSKYNRINPSYSRIRNQTSEL